MAAPPRKPRERDVPQRRWNRPEFTMSLLETLTRDALDPGYAAAAARRSQGDSPRRRSARVLLFVTLVITGLFISIAIGQIHREKPANQQQREELIAAVNESTAQSDRLQERVAELRRRVARAQAAELEKSASGQAERLRLAEYEMAAGAVAAEGSGLRITLDDAPRYQQGESGETTQTSRVLDRDLQSVVNGLWAAGAEAIAIDGQRLTSLAAIRSAGEAILVDFRPVSPPYTVLAIGDPETMQTRFAASPASQQLHALAENFGIRFEIRSDDTIRVPGASGVSLHYARKGAPQ